jgi:hypothetical protein
VRTIKALSNRNPTRKSRMSCGFVASIARRIDWRDRNVMMSAGLLFSSMSPLALTIEDSDTLSEFADMVGLHCMQASPAARCGMASCCEAFELAQMWLAGVADRQGMMINDHQTGSEFQAMQQQPRSGGSRRGSLTNWRARRAHQRNIAGQPAYSETSRAIRDTIALRSIDC